MADDDMYHIRSGLSIMWHGDWLNSQTHLLLLQANIMSHISDVYRPSCVISYAFTRHDCVSTSVANDDGWPSIYYS